MASRFADMQYIEVSVPRCCTVIGLAGNTTYTYSYRSFLYLLRVFVSVLI